MMKNIATIFNNNKICASIGKLKQSMLTFFFLFKAVVQRDLDVFVGYFRLGLSVY